MRAWTLVGVALALVTIAGVASVVLGPGGAEVPRLPRGGETGAILSPFNFSGAARTAYMAAQKYPELLDEIYCFCECSRPPLMHKSLRTCFATRHGAG